MKNNMFIKLFCLLLSVVLSFSLLSACSDKDNKDSASKNDKVNSEEAAGDGSSEDDPFGDDQYDDIPGEDDGNEDDDYGDLGDDYDDDGSSDEDMYQYNLKVYNNQKPISTKYRGVSGSVYHAYGHMKDDSTGRSYTDEMMDLELTRLKDAGVRFARTRYYSGWCWDTAANKIDFTKNRANYFFEYCKNLQDRDIDVVLTFGWHFQCFVGAKDNSGSISEVSYLTSGTGNDIYGETATYDWNKVEQFYNKYGTTYESPKLNVKMSKAACLEHYKGMVVRARRMAYFYAETLKEAKSRGIHNISHFLYMTEPSVRVDDDGEGNSIYEGRSAREYLLFTRTAKDYLTELGFGSAVKHMGPNQGSIDHGDGLLRWLLERQPDLFDVWDAHCYPSSEDMVTGSYYANVQEIFASYLAPMKEAGLFGKKEFWVDEFYCRASNAISGQNAPWIGLQNVACFLSAQQMGINNFSTWQIFDQLWTDQNNTGGEFVNGIHQVGSAPSLFVSSIPRGQYYLTQLFGRYNGYNNGTVYKTNMNDKVDPTDPDPDTSTYADFSIYIGAVKLEDGNWTITVVNGDPVTSTKIDLSFEKAIGKTFYRHIECANTVIPTTAGRLADADKTFLNVKDKMTDIIPGGSVVIYTTVKG